MSTQSKEDVLSEREKGVLKKRFLIEAMEEVLREQKQEVTSRAKEKLRRHLEGK